MKNQVAALRAGCAALALSIGILAAPAAIAEDLASDAAADSAGADIIVTGTRAATREATAEKRAADNFEETLRANDVGKLPDQNVAEAVKRLPGLSVANDQGEGRYVIIRGIDPSLVNVTLNGRPCPRPNRTRAPVKLNDLPSTMIQSIVVTKSLLRQRDRGRGQPPDQDRVRQQDAVLLRRSRLSRLV